MKGIIELEFKKGVDEEIMKKLIESFYYTNQDFLESFVFKPYSNAVKNEQEKKE